MTNVQEIWKDISGYEGYYQVSNLGEVKGVSRSEIVNGGIRYRDVVKLKNLIEKNGYFRVGLRKITGKQTKFLVSRLVAIYFIDNPLNLPQVNHIDGNKTNNHVDNLEWCTGLENIRHSVKTGLRDYSKCNPQKGEKSGVAKLTNENVLLMRLLRKEGRITYKAIGKLFGVSDGVAFAAISGRIWKHI